MNTSLLWKRQMTCAAQMLIGTHIISYQQAEKRSGLKHSTQSGMGAINPAPIIKMTVLLEFPSKKITVFQWATEDAVDCAIYRYVVIDSREFFSC
mmetsp:Transcript_11324/g.11420  ORF Transcript_11324/g.11420 Transcript_11324/m.11420 type:complete len:95 (+) Transcript_11324:382-666(+)